MRAELQKVDISDLVGKTIKEVVGHVSQADYPQAVIFTTTDGENFRLQHEQDLSEEVYIIDIAGDLSDLCGQTILLAEKRSFGNREEEVKDIYIWDGTKKIKETDIKIIKNNSFSEKNRNNGVSCQSWTFIEIRTIQSSITISWRGCSNGWYNEDVDLYIG